MYAVALDRQPAFTRRMPTPEQDELRKRQGLGQALKRLRVKAGMTQADAAGAYGCTPQALRITSA